MSRTQPTWHADGLVEGLRHARVCLSPDRADSSATDPRGVSNRPRDAAIDRDGTRAASRDGRSGRKGDRRTRRAAHAQVGPWRRRLSGVSLGPPDRRPSSTPDGGGASIRTRVLYSLGSRYPVPTVISCSSVVLGVLSTSGDCLHEDDELLSESIGYS